MAVFRVSFHASSGLDVDGSSNALISQNIDKYVNRSSIFNEIVTQARNFTTNEFLRWCFSRFLTTVQHQKRIQNSVKHLRWLTLAVDFQPLTIFAKRFVLDIWQGSEYASGIAELQISLSQNFFFFFFESCFKERILCKINTFLRFYVYTDFPFIIIEVFE